MSEQKKLYSSFTVGLDFKNVESLQNQYMHICDQFNYDELKLLIDRLGTPEFIFSDHYTFYNINDTIKVVGSALFAELSARLQKHSKYATEYQTHYIFNFSCNKKQINRYLLIKMVEIFGLENFNYTWSGAGQSFDLSNIIQELNLIGFDDAVFKSQLLSGISNIQPRFINYGESKVVDPIKTSSINNYGGNVWSWNHGLNEVYEHSAISLIAESVRFEKAAIFTEKTVYSVMACTLPIWVGGYKQASEWKRIGFDTFDDIIDHSYQNYDTLFERCYYAFKNNLHLLKDLDLATRVRQDVLNRLLENKTKLVDKLTSFNDSVLKQTPNDFQIFVKPIVARFRV